MALVSLHKVSLDFGGHPILDEVDLEIDRGARMGLVGENGSGKSSLFRLLLGEERPSDGTVTFARNVLIGYLPQSTAPREAALTVFEAVIEGSPELLKLSARLRDLQHQLEDPAAAADGDRMTRLLDELGEAQSKFEAMGGYDVEANVEAVLTS